MSRGESHARPAHCESPGLLPKDTVMLAVYADDSREPEIVQQLPKDHRKLRRFLERWSRRGEITE